MIFNCVGCGNDADLITIKYGPESDPIYGDREFYTADQISLFTLIGTDGEISTTYVQFISAFITQEGWPINNLKFKITIRSRLDYSQSVTKTPSFTFSYGIVDTTKPVITYVKGEGCTNTRPSALSCPTDGLYNNTAAKLTIFGRNFPSL